jgi:putative addiction module killer protein
MEIRKTEHFDRWFLSLLDQRTARQILMRIDRVAAGNLGDVKPVGEGVSELRIHTGPGYRVYFLQRGATLIVLLAGGDKSTQAKDIRLALALANDY